VADLDPGGVAGGDFLSIFVIIGQNCQAAFQQAKADHDFEVQDWS
jgi:urease accessory protein UreH